MLTTTRAALPVALVLAGAGLAAAHGRTQEAQEHGVDTQEVAGTIRMLEGVGGFVGGNVAACVGPDGVLVVDSYVERNRGLLVEAVTALDARQVRLAVNPHWHGPPPGNNVIPEPGLDRVKQLVSSKLLAIYLHWLVRQ